jgi:hypothetical protein
MPQMTAEKANLAKKIPSSPKKSTFFHFSNSTFGRGLVRDLFCHSGEPTPSTLTLVEEKSLTRPLPLREIRA